MRGGGKGVAGSQPMSTAVHITWPGAQINIGDLPLYLTYDLYQSGGKNLVSTKDDIETHPSFSLSLFQERKRTVCRAATAWVAGAWPRPRCASPASTPSAASSSPGSGSGRGSPTSSRPRLKVSFFQIVFFYMFYTFLEAKSLFFEFKDASISLLEFEAKKRV